MTEPPGKPVIVILRLIFYCKIITRLQFFFFYFLRVKSVGEFKKGYHTVENGARSLALGTCAVGTCAVGTCAVGTCAVGTACPCQCFRGLLNNI